MSKRTRARPVAPRPRSTRRPSPSPKRTAQAPRRGPIVIAAISGIALLVVVIAFVVMTTRNHGATGVAPWPADPPGLQQRLENAGLQVLTAEGQVQHTHQHLDLYVDGEHVTIPAGIGIDTAAQIISPIHTHDTSGIIHVESPVAMTFTLGELFDVWGVHFDAHCVGGTCDGNGRVLSVYSNGQPVTGDPRALVLTAHLEIVVAIGQPSQLPNPIPSSYQFPTGY